MPTDKVQRKAAAAAMQRNKAFVSACLDLASAQGSRSWGVGTNATDQQIAAFEAQCEDLAGIIRDSGGPFLAGREVSLPDVVMWPFMERAIVCAEVFSGYDATGCSPKIAQWVSAMQKRQSVQFAAPELDAHIAVLKRERSLDWFDWTSSGVADLHPHLRTR